MDGRSWAPIPAPWATVPREVVPIPALSFPAGRGASSSSSLPGLLGATLADARRAFLSGAQWGSRVWAVTVQVSLAARAGVSGADLRKLPSSSKAKCRQGLRSLEDVGPTSNIKQD